MVRLKDKKATEVIEVLGVTAVKLYATEIVVFSKDKIRLNTGGYNTVTTRRRMNEVSEEFNLGYKVFSKDFNIMVRYKGEDIHFWINGTITLIR